MYRHSSHCIGLTLRGLDIPVAEVGPRLGDADIRVDLLDAAVQVDGPAGVLQVVACVVDVDAVILVGQVPLDLVPGVPVDPQLVVDLFQCPLHLVLAALDVVHLSHQAVLHTIID